MNSKEKVLTRCNGLSRREFLAATITAAGGAMLFNLPSTAYASNVSPLCDSPGNALDTTRPITSVIPAGIYAQTLMETLYPEALSALAKEVSSDFADFKEAGLAGMASLPETGTPRGNFGKTLSAKQIKALGPDLVLQAGFDSNEAVSEVVKLKEDADTQIMYLDISFGKLPEAYRTLGQALGRSERANALACYIESAQKRAIDAVSDKKRFACSTDLGLMGKKLPKASVSKQTH